MTTYAEHKDEEPFDWNAALARPPMKDSTFHIFLKAKANDWVTCGCGNQCDIIPRFESGKPKDHLLSEYGTWFAMYVGGAQWQEAKDALRRIEIRSAELIKQINAKKEK